VSSSPAATAGSQGSFSHVLPPELAEGVVASLAKWGAERRMRRLWSRDASLWTGRDEARGLGWLGIVGHQLTGAGRFGQIAEEARNAGFTHALLLGMGGSSLCPEVLARTFGPTPGSPELHVLDSTDPAQIAAFERKGDPARTLYIVSSKSGTTLEPNIFKQYFFERARRAAADGSPGERFIAITDPGSRLQSAAEADGFRKIFHGVPEIGGRYSALSDFGMVPAAIAGIDVTRLLERARDMAVACGPDTPTAANPGLVLGTILGVAARGGRDKVTLFTSPGIKGLGAWLEQLLAESTGKEGRGLIPVDGERPAAPATYGSDRVFIYLRLASGPDPVQDAAAAVLERAGQPVVRITLGEPADLGGEFFRWEMATAVAGSILEINPFDQPDVEASKVATRALTDAYEKTGTLPPEKPFLESDGIALFADPANAAALKQGVGAAAVKGDATSGDPALERSLRAHLNRLRPGDYFAILAYVEMNPAHEAELQLIRHAVRDARQVATCVGFGPRFLHSTGQAYKGGPNTGVFLQVTCDDPRDLPVPDQAYTFGVVKAAQARGDFQVLAERGRRALRVHLGPNVAGGLARLSQAVKSALRT
jgi:transaldolase/glucose-6-phosphate isomerase